MNRDLGITWGLFRAQSSTRTDFAPLSRRSDKLFLQHYPTYHRTFPQSTFFNKLHSSSAFIFISEHPKAVGGYLRDSSPKNCPLRSTCIQSLQQAARLAQNLLLQKRDRINELLGARRTPWNIHVHRNHLIDALHQRIIIENPA